MPSIMYSNFMISNSLFDVFVFVCQGDTVTKIDIQSLVTVCQNALNFCLSIPSLIAAVEPALANW